MSTRSKASVPGGLSASRWASVLVLLFIVSLAIRVWSVTAHPAAPSSDPADYHRLASELVSGQGYSTQAGAPTAWRPPGYPFFLAAVYEVTGIDYRAATYVQCVLGAFTVVLLALLGDLTLGRREGLIAGAIAGVYPALYWLPRILFSENLSLLLQIAALCLAAALPARRFALRAASLGVVLGLSVLVRGANLFAAGLIVVGLLLLWQRGGVEWSRRLAVAAIICAAIAAVLTPWTIRNYRVFGRLVPVATQGGLTLYGSYWPPVREGKRIWGDLPGNEDPAVAAANSLTNEVETSNYLSAVVRQRLLAHPAFFFRLWPEKLMYMAVPFDWEWFPHDPAARRTINFGYVLILIPALLGLVALVRAPVARWWPLVVLPISVLVQTLLFYGSPRFRLPAEVIGILFAAAGLCYVWAWATASSRKKAVESAAARNSPELA